MRRPLIQATAVLLACAASAAAASTYTLYRTHVFSLAGGKTRSLKVAYPDALKYGGSKYSGKVKILPPAAGARSPSLQKVHVLSKHSCLGGSDFCVKVRNDNSSSTAPVHVKVETKTQLPPGKKP